MEFYFHSHRLRFDVLTPQCPRADEWTRSWVWRHEMDVKKSAQKRKIGDSHHCCTRMDLRVSCAASGGCHLLSQDIQHLAALDGVE